jgi:hypothetical protein
MSSSFNSKGTPSSKRGIKISPLLKEDYRENFINKCLLRVKRDRESNFAKLRGHFNEDCGSYAREIVSECHMDTTTTPTALDYEFNHNHNNYATTYPKTAPNLYYSDDEEGPEDVDFFVQVMEQLVIELQIEYAEYIEEQHSMETCDAVSILGVEAEVPDEEFLLCPFCR